MKGGGVDAAVVGEGEGKGAVVRLAYHDALRVRYRARLGGNEMWVRRGMQQSIPDHWRSWDRPAPGII